MTEILSEMPAELLDIEVFHIIKDFAYIDAPVIERTIELGSKDISSVWPWPADVVKRARQLYEETRENHREEE
jgi:hypothetical protein